MTSSLPLPPLHPLNPSKSPATISQDHLDKIHDVCEKMEASFLAEMLKEAKFGETPEAFGGGIGEDQFASFLRQAQADEMAKGGGIGLAENLFQALIKSHGDRS